MKKIKLILKGILLYSTTLFIMLFVMALESIIEQSMFWSFIIFLITSIFLVFACNKFITKKDFYILTFQKYFK